MEKYTCWSLVMSIWILLWCSGSQLFVWLFMCEIREHVRHETVKKRTFGMLETNASIDCNAASVRAALMNYFVWLNWTLPTVNCDFFSKSVCVLHCFVWSNCNTSFNMPAFIIGKLSKDLCKCNVKQCMKLYF